MKVTDVWAAFVEAIHDRTFAPGIFQGGTCCG
jgi:hypothetical protein